jgi:hypothetical protein
MLVGLLRLGATNVVGVFVGPRDAVGDGGRVWTASGLHLGMEGRWTGCRQAVDMVVGRHVPFAGGGVAWDTLGYRGAVGGLWAGSCSIWWWWSYTRTVGAWRDIERAVGELWGCWWVPEMRFGVGAGSGVRWTRV